MPSKHSDFGRVRPNGLTTAALSAAAGVTRGALRLYEREGLLAAPLRTNAGYRQYPPDTVQRLQAIAHLKEIGFTLKEIALMLDERDSGDLFQARLREMAGEQLCAVDARIARLLVVRRYLEAVVAGDTKLFEDSECSFLVDFLTADARAPLPRTERVDSAVADQARAPDEVNPRPAAGAKSC